MRTLKRFMGLTLAGLLLALLGIGSVAFGGEATVETRAIEGSSGILLRIAWIGDGQNKELLDKCLQKYTEKTGIGVEVVFIPGSWAEYFTKIQTMIAGGDKLDVVNVAIEGFAMIVDLGIAKPIEDWVAAHQEEFDAVANDIDENVKDFMVFDGRLYGIPNEWNNVVTHINLNLLEEAGLEMPPPDWDKEEFLRYAKALTKDRGDGTKQYGLYVPNYYFALESWLYNNNAAYMTEDFTKSLLLEPEVVEIFQFMSDLIYVHEVAPVPKTGDDTARLLMNGDIAMHFAGRWPTNAYVYDGFERVGLQYNPNFKTNVSVWGGTAIFTLKDSEHPDEATSLAIYLSSAPFIEEFMAAGAIPVLNSVAERIVPALGFPLNNEIYFESAKIAKAVQSPPQYAECAGLIERTLTDILVNRVDVVEALTVADAELNMILLDNIK